MLQIRKEVFYGEEWIIKVITEDRKNSMVSIGKKNVVYMRLPLNLQREERAKTIRELTQWAKERIPINKQKETT